MNRLASVTPNHPRRQFEAHKPVHQKDKFWGERSGDQTSAWFAQQIAHREGVNASGWRQLIRESDLPGYRSYGLCGKARRCLQSSNLTGQTPQLRIVALQRISQVSLALSEKAELILQRHRNTQIGDPRSVALGRVKNPSNTFNVIDNAFAPGLKRHRDQRIPLRDFQPLIGEEDDPLPRMPTYPFQVVQKFFFDIVELFRQGREIYRAEPAPSATIAQHVLAVVRTAERGLWLNVLITFQAQYRGRQPFGLRAAVAPIGQP